MMRTPVTSTNLRSVGYDPVARSLEIEFQDGHVYRYSGIGESIVSGLMRAWSKGTYFHENIKDRYAFRQIG